jgi:adenine deaminase
MNAMKRNVKTASGNIVDVLNSEIYPGTLKIADGKIVDILRQNHGYRTALIPGFVDAHIHIESSMLTPSEFARVAVINGTVATVSDPHEIANVLGVNGVRYMVEDAERAPVKFYFGAPSCVPVSPFETSGACIGPDQVEELLRLDEIRYLGEVMNFPQVLLGHRDAIRKISIAKKYSKPIDGHAPGLKGEDLVRYVNAGISTDHECFTKEEALEKIGLGMKVQIREASAAKNFDELIPIVKQHPHSCMFCSDDRHPDDLIKGHINDLVKRALDHGIDMMKVLRVACVNPVLHYKLDVGLLRVGDCADFLEVSGLHDPRVLRTYINGEIVAEGGRSLVPRRAPRVVNKFIVGKKELADFSHPYGNGNLPLIEAIDGQLITNKQDVSPKIVKGCAVSDTQRDILKLAVVNRYRDTRVAIGFVRNFGLKKGAIASSVAHDSHNIIAVGVTDEDLCRAVNVVIENKGGITAVSEDREMVLPLPIAGIMSNESYSEVAKIYTDVDNMAKSLGSTLQAPFMTLSFMALLVIPRIKLSDKGLFDVEKLEFITPR